jgi:hypothetical protein
MLSSLAAFCVRRVGQSVCMAAEILTISGFAAAAMLAAKPLSNVAAASAGKTCLHLQQVPHIEELRMCG